MGEVLGQSHALRRYPRGPRATRETLAERGEPSFRARQVWAWAARGAGGYEAMTDLPLDLRAALAERVPFSTLRVEREAQAADGTVKALFSTADGRPVEAVLMRYRDGRRSVCVSSQSGCPLTCTFCATGAMRFGRNLSASEILDQVLHFRRLDAVNHLVFMGMGEPLMNVDACSRRPSGSRTRASRTVAPGSRRSAGSPASSASTEFPFRSGSRSRCTPPTRRCARSSCPSTSATPSARCSPRARPTTRASAARCSSST